MKARVIKTGEIVDVKEWRGASNTIYTRADMNAFYEHFEIELMPDNPEEVTIEGWVTRSKNEKIVFSDSPECKRGSCVWYHKEGSNIVTLSETGLFDEDILPSVTWETEPLKVRLTLTPIK